MFRRAAVLSMVVSTWMAPAVFAQVKLEYKFPEGSATTVKSTIKAQQVLSINGMDNETESERVMTETRTIGKRGIDGTLPIVETLDSIRIHLSLMGVDIDFDTAQPDAKIDNPQLSFLGDLLKLMAGSSYTIVIDDKNQFKSVEGLEKLLEKAKDLDPMAVEGLKASISADVLKREFQQDHSNLPPVLAREGETWETTEVNDIGGGQTLTFRRRYEYLGTAEKDGRSVDKIGIKALEVTYAMGQTGSPAKVEKSNLKVDSTKGTMLFDREAGRLVERNEVNRIKGDMTFKINEMEFAAKLDLTLEMTTQEDEAKKAK
jgi:hypothetical protein